MVTTPGILHRSTVLVVVMGATWGAGRLTQGGELDRDARTGRIVSGGASGDVLVGVAPTVDGVQSVAVVARRTPT